jgi:hypothetical protein
MEALGVKAEKNSALLEQLNLKKKKRTVIYRVEIPSILGTVEGQRRYLASFIIN